DADEWQRAARVSLFNHHCKMLKLNDLKDKLIEQSSMLVQKDTTLALISLPIQIQSERHQQLLQKLVKIAREKANRASSGQLQVICIKKFKTDGQRPTEEEEEESIREVLKWLPEGSCAIPSTDTRRYSVIQFIFFSEFGNSASGKLGCFMADMWVDNQELQGFDSFKIIPEDKISEKIPQKLPAPQSLSEENDIPNEIGECIKLIARESHTGKNMYEMFALALRRANIDNFTHKEGKVRVDHLEGKVVGLIMCDPNSIEFATLQQICTDLLQQHPNFQGIWIPLLKNGDFGFGTYKRTIDCMPWVTLPDPKLVTIKDKNPCIFIFDKEGKIVNQNALSLMMAWGTNAYPFTQLKINEVISNVHTSSSLDFMLKDVHFFDQQGEEEKKESINNKKGNTKLVFLYAEPPSSKLKMKSKLKQLLQIHKDVTILYVGHFSSLDEDNVMELEKVYKDVTDNMSWPKLSFWDM
ncbi:hypothetical protein KI387_039079, partial [Taxus chinensis]